MIKNWKSAQGKIRKPTDRDELVRLAAISVGHSGGMGPTNLLLFHGSQLPLG